MHSHACSFKLLPRLPIIAATIADEIHTVVKAYDDQGTVLHKAIIVPAELAFTENLHIRNPTRFWYRV
jgi:hypothetical protein